MTRRVAAARIGAVLAAVLALVEIALFVILESSDVRPTSFLSHATDLLLSFSFAAVGSLVALRRPGNLVGSGLLLAGLGSLVENVSRLYGEVALLTRPDLDLPAGAAVAATSLAAWTPLMAGIFLMLVTFPGGVVPSRRVGRWITCVLAGFGLLWVVLTLASPELDWPLGPRDNPLALAEADWLLVIAVPVNVAVLLSAAVAAVGVIRRFRRSRGLERAQFKWIASSVTLVLLAFPTAIFSSYAGAAGAALAIALAFLPISIGIAVLRYRLFEIDRIISRTLAYLVLTVILGAAYGALVVAGQALFSSFAGGSNLAIALSTLVAAALFLPLRARIQTVVDRRFNRRRYDAQGTLAAFGARLRDQLDAEALDRELRRVVTTTMQPASISTWRRIPR